MSTRATVHFEHHGKTRAIVYRHSDGYPEGLGEDLKQFFADVKEQTGDTRFSHATYLAAKYVVWQANKYAETFDVKLNKYVPSNMLDFLSVGVVMEDPGDIEYRYHVNCDTKDGEFPVVKYD